jgi:hypothetical protein
MIMGNDDERLTVAPAPLPRHERSWRHPSEIGQQRRTDTRRSAPPLSPLVALLVGTLGSGLVAGLVALVMPRDATREARPLVRNAAVSTPDEASSDLADALGLFPVDDGRFVLAVNHGTEDFFVTTGDTGAIVVDINGRPVQLRVVDFDMDLGITVLRADTRVDVSVAFETSTVAPAVGSRVTVGASKSINASVGVSVSFDPATFVPLAGEVLSVDVADASPVMDTEGRMIGLFTSRDDARGYMPISAVNVLLSRLP